MSSSLDLSRDDQASAYRGRLAGEQVTEIDYRLDGRRLIITHTGTALAHRGHGYAGEVTRYALDDARARGLQVVPRCPYTAVWIKAHPEYADLLA
jgi:hypothetical protein